MIQKICGLLLMVVLGVSGTFALNSHAEVQKYYLDGFARKGVPVLSDPRIQITIPAYVKPDPSGTNMDIDYRISTLPTKYQSHDEYFIFPKAGTVIPIVNFSPQHKIIVDRGGEVDHFPYLERGAVHHRGKKPWQGNGNFTIAGHTSFEKALPGDFKTNMQGIILADPGDIVLYVHKVNASTRRRYTYRITQSFETDANNVSILLDNPSIEHELTVYGCSPIGSTEKRWIIKSSLISTDDIPLQSIETLMHPSAEAKDTQLSGSVLGQQIIRMNQQQEVLYAAIQAMPLRTEQHFLRIVNFIKLIVQAETMGIIPTEYKDQTTFMKTVLIQRALGHVRRHKHLIIHLQDIFLPTKN